MKVELQRVAPADIEAREHGDHSIGAGERSFPAEVLACGEAGHPYHCRF